MSSLINANPTVFAPSQASIRKPSNIRSNRIWMEDDWESEDDVVEEVEPIDEQEIFDLIRSISDPEHPLTLEQLRVVSAEQIELTRNSVTIEFTPTVPHCGMSTIIGLCIQTRLMRSLPHRFKIDLRVKPGSHQSEHAVNKQLNDKERVAAALENPALLDVVEKCLATSYQSSLPPSLV